ncbi:hypothetical protein [Chromobacterium sp. CV08]|uniref:hypothetical protein n=1 Tax=Chromobacterium sp. CV08 TaxID=3133274 RepID=UPI003DA89317
MEHNFKINYVPIVADEKKAIIAVYVVESSRNVLGFHDEIRVIVDLESDVVSSIRGRLIYRMS